MRLADLDIVVVGNPPPSFGGRYFIFVKVTTACGIVGWGEVYAASVGPGAMAVVIRDVFARHMEGEAPDRIELMFRRVHSAGFSQRPDPTVIGAFSGLEMACWDFVGKARDRPVHALLGGRVQAGLRAYSYLYPDPGEAAAGFYASPERAAARAEELVGQGLTAVKFAPAGPYAIMGGHQPSMADLDRSEAFCAAIRGAVGVRADLLFGTHGQVTPSGAVRLARRLEPYDPLWFEEPCPPDLTGDMAEVAQATRIPVALGERMTTKYEFAQALRAGAARILQPALGRVGGIWEAKKIAVLAEGFGAQIAPHLYAGPVAWAANVQLGLTCPNFLIAESIGLGGGFHDRLLRTPIRIENGHIRPPDGPGLGIELDEDVAQAHPWSGEALHLEMSPDPKSYADEAPFAGG